LTSVRASNSQEPTVVAAGQQSGDLLFFIVPQEYRRHLVWSPQLGEATYLTGTDDRLGRFPLMVHRLDSSVHSSVHSANSHGFLLGTTVYDNLTRLLSRTADPHAAITVYRLDN
jgi:hypothetical protein